VETLGRGCAIATFPSPKLPPHQEEYNYNYKGGKRGWF